MKLVEVSGGDNLNKFIRKLTEQTAKASVEAGFLDSENATKAAQNEYGGFVKVDDEWKQRAIKKGIKNPPEFWHITPRPFMRDTVINCQKSWAKTLGEALIAQEFDVRNALGVVGERMQMDIRNTISNNNYPRTAAPFSTVKGFDKPLIDTGTMLQSVDYEVHV